MTIKYWSCDRWGDLQAEMAGIQDPLCSCSMCERKRSDMENYKKNPKKSR